MKSVALKTLLGKVTASKQAREDAALWVLRNPNVLEELLQLAVDPQQENSVKASWVLDLVVENRIETLNPYLDTFLSGLKRVRDESALRPLARICEQLLLENEIQRGALSVYIGQEQLNALTAIAFDWLIGPHKVATKVYSMSCLFIIGKQLGWIHPELREVLKRDFGGQSAGYRARARMILKKIEARLANNGR